MIKILPDYLSFGCVSQGYAYSLNVTVINKGDKPQALRVTISQSDKEPNKLRSHFVPIKIASGTKQVFRIDLLAEFAGTCSFTLHITQGQNRHTEIKRVSALIVPLDVFKHVAKSLTLQKRPIYRNGVTVVGALGGAEESRSVVTASGASVLSEAMMDDADLEELLDLPLVDGVYFDHSTMELRVDEELCKVEVGDWTVEESVAQTLQSHRERMDDLEDRGFHTARSVKLQHVGGNGDAGAGVHAHTGRVLKHVHGHGLGHGHGAGTGGDASPLRESPTGFISLDEGSSILNSAAMIDLGDD
jgi:hypothetical protein